MKRTLLSLALVATLGPAALAQDPFATLDDAPPTTTLSAPVAPLPQASPLAPAVPLAAIDSQQETLPLLTPSNITPEMWLYSQEVRRHDDPAQAVRRKAEFRAAQRMQRVAAMKYFGMSNARPQAECVPMMGHYSPAWVGNGQDRYDWAGVGSPGTVLRIETIQR
jgi:hypothetical protein